MDAHSPAPGIRFPAGRQFALLWSIPDTYGGMTSAVLHRSRAFVRLAGQPVTVLTFDARPDYPDLEARLRQLGELVDGMQLVNIWDWFREHDIAPDASAPVDLERHPLIPLGADLAYSSLARAGTELSRTRYAADGTTVLQVDYYRQDGSLLASDRRDTRRAGELGGRSVVLCDRTGTPVRSWGRIWPLYRFWLDQLRQREPSFLLVDSKTVARFAMTYRRKRAVLVHVVHSSHLKGEKRPIAPLRESRRPVFENLSDWDAVVVLTRRQKKDIERLLGHAPNLCVIPNSRDLDQPSDIERERPVGSGVVLASLTSRKRVDHAARAAVQAAARSTGVVTLDVFGDGEERPAIENWLADLGVTDTVRLHGYRPDARSQLAEASFVVLTGRTEGFPLVLVEAMAAGCIPIAYDVPYGPADIIHHGRNGFLVATGDEAAIADAIVELQQMSPREVARLRRNARRAAEAFSDVAVTQTWASQLRKAEMRKAAGWIARRAAG